MWLIPYQKFTLRSKLSPEEAIAKLEDNLYAQNDLTLGTYDRNKQFSGVVDDDKTFLVKRSLSDEEIAIILIFKPLSILLNFGRFSGAVLPEDQGCRIKVKAKMSDLAIGFWGFIMALFIVPVLTYKPEFHDRVVVKNGFALIKKVQDNDVNSFIYIAAGIYIVLLISFQIQAAITRKHLAKIFEAEAK